MPRGSGCHMDLLKCPSECPQARSISLLFLLLSICRPFPFSYKSWIMYWKCVTRSQVWEWHILTERVAFGSGRMSEFIIWSTQERAALVCVIPHVSILVSSLLLDCSHSVSQPQFRNVLQGLFFENLNSSAYSPPLWELQNPYLISKSLPCCFRIDEHLQKRL